MPTFSVAPPPRRRAPERARARAQAQAPKQAQSQSARTGGRNQGGRPLFRSLAQAAACAGVAAFAALLGGCAAPGLPAPSGPEFPINAAPGSPSANGFGRSLSFPFDPAASQRRHVPADRPQNAQARARGAASGLAPV